MFRSIYDIGISYTDKQEAILNPFFRETPFFNSMPCIEASKGPVNIYEKVKEIKIPEFVNYDAPLPNISASTELGYATIGKVGGRMNIPKDKARLLGKEEIIAKQMPLILNKAGQAFDYSYLYNGVKAYCLENKANCVTRIGTAGSGNTYFSMIGVTWSEGGNCGLYQPALSGEKMFDIYPLGGGNEMNIPDNNGNNITGYVIEVACFIGIQLPDPQRVHALVNIDSSNIPTLQQLLDFQFAFGGYGNNSVIYCHPLVFNKLAASLTKDSKVGDGMIERRDGRLYINGCPVILNPNMLNGTEAYVES